MKRIKIMAIAAALVVTCSGSALSCDNVSYLLDECSSETASISSSVALMRSAGTTWRYRTYKGSLQKRLWSVDENKWLSDWMDA